MQVITMNASGEYPDMPQSREITLEVINVNKPKEVEGGKWSYNAANRTLTIKTDLTKDAKIRIL